MLQELYEAARFFLFFSTCVATGVAVHAVWRFFT